MFAMAIGYLHDQVLDLGNKARYPFYLVEWDLNSIRK